MDEFARYRAEMNERPRRAVDRLDQLLEGK